VLVGEIQQAKRNAGPAAAHHRHEFARAGTTAEGRDTRITNTSVVIM